MKREFNVVCVTKCCTYQNGSHAYSSYHHDITGKAVLDTENNIIEFNGETYPVSYIGGKGLDGMAFMLGIEVCDPGFNVWELYTDTPAENSNATPEAIRENAKRTVARAHMHR